MNASKILLRSTFCYMGNSSYPFRRVEVLRGSSPILYSEDNIPSCAVKDRSAAVSEAEPGLSQLAIALSPCRQGRHSKTAASKPFRSPAKDAAAPPKRGAPASGKRRLGYSGQCAVTRVQQDAFMHHYSSPQRSHLVAWRRRKQGRNGGCRQAGDSVHLAGERSPDNKGAGAYRNRSNKLMAAADFQKIVSSVSTPKSHTNLSLTAILRS